MILGVQEIKAYSSRASVIQAGQFLLSPRMLYFSFLECRENEYFYM